MKVILNVATLGHRPDRVVDLDDDVASQLIADGHARPVPQEATPVVVAPVAPVEERTSRRQTPTPPSDE